GDAALSGKPGDSDFLEGKRTYPLIAAWTRADPAGRAELARLWDLEHKDVQALRQARLGVERFGGRAATERAIARATRHARRGLAQLPEGPVRALLDSLVSKLAQRSA
ncbi:MAG: polyprenyl synthetase family protein, partial [Myxococcales bacterium]